MRIEHKRPPSWREGGTLFVADDEKKTEILLQGSDYTHFQQNYFEFDRLTGYKFTEKEIIEHLVEKDYRKTDGLLYSKEEIEKQKDGEKKLFKVEITETLQKIVEIRAINEIEAHDIVQKMYEDMKINLCAENLKEFTIKNFVKPGLKNDVSHSTRNADDKKNFEKIILTGGQEFSVKCENFAKLEFSVDEADGESKIVCREDPYNVACATATTMVDGVEYRVVYLSSGMIDDGQTSQLIDPDYYDDELAETINYALKEYAHEHLVAGIKASIREAAQKFLEEHGISDENGEKLKKLTKQTVVITTPDERTEMYVINIAPHDIFSSHKIEKDAPEREQTEQTPAKKLSFAERMREEAKNERGR